MFSPDRGTGRDRRPCRDGRRFSSSFRKAAGTDRWRLRSLPVDGSSSCKCENRIQVTARKSTHIAHRHASRAGSSASSSRRDTSSPLDKDTLDTTPRRCGSCAGSAGDHTLSAAHTGDGKPAVPSHKAAEDIAQFFHNCTKPLQR